MLIGEIASVYALRAPQRFLDLDGDDTSVALLRFHNGAVGTLVASLLMQRLATAAGAEVHSLRIDGDQGSLTVGADRLSASSASGRKTSWAARPSPTTWQFPRRTRPRKIAHVLAVIRTGAAPLTSGRSQRVPLAGMLAAYRSMDTGLPVAL
jgi:predicted dehydrogenase